MTRSRVTVNEITMEALAPVVERRASPPRRVRIVIGAIAAVWLPLFVPLAFEWFEHEGYRGNWLQGLYWRPGALLAAALLLPIQSVDPLVFQLAASFLALVVCGALAALAMRSRRAGIWILCAGAALSLAHACLLAFLATHG